MTLEEKFEKSDLGENEELSNLEHDEAKLLNRSFNYGKAAYVCLFSTSRHDAMEKLQKNINGSDSEINVGELHRELLNQRITINSEVYQMGEESEEKIFTMPSEWNFGNSLKKHLEEMREKRDFAKKEGKIEDESRYGVLANDLLIFGKGFAHEAFKNDDLSAATHMWISLGEFKKPEIENKMRERLREWASEGGHDEAMARILMSVKKYKKPKGERLEAEIEEWKKGRESKDEAREGEKKERDELGELKLPSGYSVKTEDEYIYLYHNGIKKAQYGKGTPQEIIEKDVERLAALDRERE